MSFETAIMSEIRTVPNFPKEGINFIDITSFLAKGLLPVFTKEFVGVIESHFQPYEGEIVNVAIVAPESRGFIFGTPVADRIQSPFIPARKKGKLPCETVSCDYTLEYGTDTLHMHKEDLQYLKDNNFKVVIIDDLLATGGTLLALTRELNNFGIDVPLVISLFDLKEIETEEKKELRGRTDLISLIEL